MRFLTPFLAAAALAPAFVPPLAQADTIKVGIANDISGPFAALGAEARDGFNLAIKQLGSKLGGQPAEFLQTDMGDRKSTRLNSSHLGISYAVFCLKKKKK